MTLKLGDMLDGGHDFNSYLHEAEDTDNKQVIKIEQEFQFTSARGRRLKPTHRSGRANHFNSHQRALMTCVTASTPTPYTVFQFTSACADDGKILHKSI